MSDNKSMQMVEIQRKRLVREWGPRHFTNMLDEMMGMQKRFGSRFVKFGKLTMREKEKWTKEFVLCCYDELSEIINWVNWKHWKKKKSVNKLEVKYEIIDLLHFLLSLMLVWDMTPNEVFSMYIAKNRENHNRQKRGY